MSFLNRRFKYTYKYVTIIIILVNVLVYLITCRNARLTAILSLNPVLCVYKKMFWQVFTYMFMHANFNHIFCNMLGLLFFGLSLERALGSKEFALFYLLSGTLCGVLSLIVYLIAKLYGVYLMGASGALFAILLAFSAVYPRTTILVFYIIPVPAPILVIGYAVIEVINELFGFSSNVAHLTHLFGFAIAWIYFVVRIGINPWKAWKNALH